MNSINKTEALTRLSTLENEVKELRKIINKDEYTLSDLNSYQDACQILNQEAFIDASYAHQIKTIIKAANYIDNKVIWKPDFTNINQHKYLPYFRLDGPVFGFGGVGGYCCLSHCPVGFYYKVSSTATLITTRFLSLYEKYIKEEE